MCEAFPLPRLLTHCTRFYLISFSAYRLGLTITKFISDECCWSNLSNQLWIHIMVIDANAVMNLYFDVIFKGVTYVLVTYFLLCSYILIKVNHRKKEFILSFWFQRVNIPWCWSGGSKQQATEVAAESSWLQLRRTWEPTGSSTLLLVRPHLLSLPNKDPVFKCLRFMGHI